MIFWAMTLEQAVLEKLRKLPPEQQQEVLEFTESLQSQKNTKTSLKSVKGLWSELKLEITGDQITQAREEMWKNFPSEKF